MSNILIYDPSTGFGLQYIQSVNTPDYAGRSDVLINPNMSEVPDIPIKYIIVENGIPQEMTDEQKAAVDAANPPQESTEQFLQDEIDDIYNNLTDLDEQFPDISAKYQNSRPVMIKPGGQVTTPPISVKGASV
jgi:hypothetical protein